MNYSMVRYILFRIIRVMGCLLMLPFLVALVYREYDSAESFFLLIVVTLIIGIVGSHIKPKSKVIYAKEGFTITALAWILISLLGAVPFVMTGTIPNYIDALFETISGFTTTGGSILTSMDGIEKSVQFWRTFTHWIGGMGVLVFLLAVVPMADGYSMHLMRAESPGPVVGKIVPKVKDTAKILYLIYLGITLAEIICLFISGLPIYDAVTISFSTVGTGGFAINNAGIGGYSTISQAIIIVFMALCGVNFTVYYFLLNRKPKEAFAIDEVKYYFGVMFIAAAIISLNIYRAGVLDSAGLSFHHALFAVTSVMTTTGFGTLDFDKWPMLSKMILCILSLIGACAGSTGGGFKFSRVIIVVRNARNELNYLVHPKAVKRVYMDGHTVEGTTVKSVSAYLGLYVVTFIASTLVVALDNFDFQTTVTSVAATLNNIGPGLGMVGPMGNYSEFSYLSKIVLMFDMLAGRLELLPIYIMIKPKTWSK
ncbi:trk system potassium uptake protein TrkH [Butyrivibrio hungatei DSM 14810]|uniref:Trk system potassium uptake protein TrkH n=1 Tax=Butyrivibrio hungatei DSM 14810 TaxID=1121132 RepID=A0A1M7RVW6_9FIRM|nr:TrkH family potassium uptake protein [Butyrivibrio hungatei]SHN50341.1 trk system potassium uptake protein TrkH [Butyrivibrio hungatei DSM 14810]